MLKKSSLAAVISLALITLATQASAVTITYSKYVSGANIGNTTIATLDVLQNGDELDFILENNLFAPDASSFIKDLSLTYIGSSLGELAFDQVDAKFKKKDIKSGKNGRPDEVKVSFATSNSGGNRLTFGTSSSFTLSGASLQDFDFSPGKTQVHMNESEFNQSSKYTTEIAPVPLPAAGLLLMGALGGLGFFRARRRNLAA